MEKIEVKKQSYQYHEPFTPPVERSGNRLLVAGKSKKINHE